MFQLPLLPHNRYIHHTLPGCAEADPYMKHAFVSLPHSLSYCLPVCFPHRNVTALPVTVECASFLFTEVIITCSDDERMNIMKRCMTKYSCELKYTTKSSLQFVHFIPISRKLLYRFIREGVVDHIKQYLRRRSYVVGTGKHCTASIRGCLDTRNKDACRKLVVVHNLSHFRDAFAGINAGMFHPVIIGNDALNAHYRCGISLNNRRYRRKGDADTKFGGYQAASQTHPCMIHGNFVDKTPGISGPGVHPANYLLVHLFFISCARLHKNIQGIHFG